MKYKDDFPKELFAYRKRNKKTQQQMADLLGVTAAAFGNWERGQDFPSMSNWVKLHDECGFAMDEYQDRSESCAVNSRNFGPAVAANAKSGGENTVSVGQISASPGAILIELTQSEYDLVKKLRDYGNQSLREKWMKDLSILESISR